MTARVLVVDDVSANVMLLEAKLTAEYFDVLTAMNGEDALEIAERELPDIVLLDVMMPGLSGYDVCRRLKASNQTCHIPVVLLTALDRPEDRVTGLESGADDFLTKPCDDVALLARVRSLVRLKTTTDELRMREETGQRLGLVQDADAVLKVEPDPGNIMIVDDIGHSSERVRETLELNHTVMLVDSAEEAMESARTGAFNLIIVSLCARSFDGLRLCSSLRSTTETRSSPILVLIREGEMGHLVRALDMGVNDYLIRPVDVNELKARVRTQLRQKSYTDRLRDNFKTGLEMAVTDELTGLYNRRYMSGHVETLVQGSADSGKPISFLIVDIDFFKAVNDTHGHDAGDEVLRQFAKRLSNNVRGVDLACRYGGEEFVVVMPDTDLALASAVAERLRRDVADEPFTLNEAGDKLDVTISIGITSSESVEDTAEGLLSRADEALYRAKREGRNRVVANAA